MPGLKRKPSLGSSKPTASSSEASTSKKKARSDAAPAAAPPSTLVDSSQVDFPRGGGSGLTQFEHASTLREARAELAKSSRGGDDLFSDNKTSAKAKLSPEDEQKRKDAKRKMNREKNNAKKKKVSLVTEEPDKSKASKDHIRIEHLNYKRLAPGTRLLCSIAAVHPLALILSLPNQLVGHVPITSISPLFTQKLHEAAEADSDDEQEDKDSDDEEKAAASSKRQARLASGLPELRDCFKVGQWVRAAVVNVFGAGVKKGAVPGQEAHEYDRESRRVELTLAPEAINEGVEQGDLAKGFVLPVAIKSREDHGFLLDAGIEGVQGFAPFDQVDASSFYLGQVIDAAITSVASQGRSFTASLKAAAVKAAILGPESAPSSTALVPGCQVTALVTAALPHGLNVKLWGMFDATIDSFHLPAALPAGKEMHEVYKVGSKVKGRILWEARQNEMGAMGAEANQETSGPRAVALSAAPHVLAMSSGESASLQGQYPIGAKVEAKVTRTDSDWGLTCSVKGANSSSMAFVHISRVSDDHVVKLPPRSGPFALGTTHEARVIGHAPTDRLLLLSLQQSTLDKKFMRVNEVEVGSTVRASINRIGANGSAIFLNLGGAFEGVVFPLHFADVVLKKPEKKYKPGATVKARVLNVDSARNRIVCTLKKSLVTSELPMISSLQDARVGVVTQGTVSKFVENRGMIVDLFGGLRAFVPASEATESSLLSSSSAPSLTQHFFEGKVVKLRLTHVDYENHKLLASVKQASPSYLAKMDVAAVQVGEKVTATVAAVHQDVVVLEVQPSKVRGLYSLAVLANQRDQTVEEVREALQDGETLGDLVVVDKHADRGIVILGDAKQPLKKPRTAALGEPLNVGSIQTGMVQGGAGGEPNTVTIALAGGNCRARLHLTDVSDDFSKAIIPNNGEQLQVYVVRLRNFGKRANISTRPSHLTPDAAADIKDSEIDLCSDLTVGTKARGFVKAVTAAGLFVDLGRNATARVMISELFDDFVQDWQPRFTVGQLVEGTVTAVDAANNKAEFSLRTNPGQSKKKKADKKAELQKVKADEAGSSTQPLRLKDLSKGMKVNGFIRAVQEYGVFVQIEGTQISGLAHKSQLSDHAGTTDPTRAFSVGDRVKALVLDVHKGGEGKRGKVDFGLKPSYFSKEDFEEDEEDEDEEDEEEDEKDEDDEDKEMSDADEQDDEDEEEDEDEEDEEDDDEDDDEDIEIDTEALLARGSDDEEDVLKLGGDSDEDEDDDENGDDEDEDDEDGEDGSDSDEEEEASTSATATAAGKPRPALELSGGFSWSAPEGAAQANADSDSDSSDEDDEADGAAKSTATTKKPRVKRGALRPLEDDLTADLANKAPESATDFERMLLSSPNSSYLWIQFMSFHLQLSEVAKARAVGRRALKVINYREEAEKQNVWIALLNLENSYGTPEALEELFKEAVQYNDAKTMHLRLASILEQTGKVQEAQELWARTTKRFGGADVDVWVLCSQFLLRQEGKGDDARALLPRALQALDKSKHVAVISRFALNEFKHQGGDIERGRTIYEGLVDSYPKRLDLWWQYIDQEAAAGNVAEARSLFERVLEGRRLSTKKARSVLKKWLDFEKAKGDAKGERAVLERARKFVEEVKRAKGGDEEDGDDAMEEDEDEQSENDE
ncbi:hypothetical protein BDZ90DRAFT_232714 [Jaminaea rosea]|uniref:S1 motif domain-containing protein n=1 Tax=Jaminaea rosea TaxID=1569628 RepID=A0A316UPF2_9BASI|nr:hypothetical protein BDZ90DRAFT_232714 [Jaminaea rosea]PWN27160.1 hypothetical protein BDZ90DRAFT_232714 [Jaminaea rosea]